MEPRPPLYSKGRPALAGIMQRQASNPQTAPLFNLDTFKGGDFHVEKLMTQLTQLVLQSEPSHRSGSAPSTASTAATSLLNCERLIEQFEGCEIREHTPLHKSAMSQIRLLELTGLCSSLMLVRSREASCIVLNALIVPERESCTAGLRRS